MLTPPYVIAIKTKEKTLKINVDLKSTDYTYEIEGNKELKNGSIIKVNILKNNEKVLTYEFEIEKNDILANPKTGQAAIIIVFIISFTSIIIIRLMRKNNIKKET